MQRLFYIIIACFFLIKTVAAQNTIFVNEGRIEYEKKIDLWAQIDESPEDESWKELDKKQVPQFKLSYSNLFFNNNKTLFEPGRENTDNNRLWQEPAEDNTVFINLTDSLSIAQKNVYEQTFLLRDSTRKIKWKITDETRNIAGFDCRRANAIIMDSIYVVAFYTDEITTTGGPESFNGLPGMILGLALPHEHITWFATKVYSDDVTDAQLSPPTKGKKTNSKALLITLQDLMKDWGRWGKQYQRQIMM
ncbi:MAG: GLPGLI family protein [Parafilimonas sp.]